VKEEREKKDVLLEFMSAITVRGEPSRKIVEEDAVKSPRITKGEEMLASLSVKLRLP